VPFGVNLFAPNPVPVDAEAYRRYAHTIQAEAGRAGGLATPERPARVPAVVPIGDLVGQVRHATGVPVARILTRPAG
jgi:hypothetical protein